MAKWKWFYDVMLQRYDKGQQLCFMNYERMTEDVITELRPCLEFIGFEMVSEQRLGCVKREQEGKHHRMPMSSELLDKVYNQTFSQDELAGFREVHQEILARIMS